MQIYCSLWLVVDISSSFRCGEAAGCGAVGGQSLDEDLRLVERVKANDSVAFDTLVRKYRIRLFSIIYNMTSNRDDAFDLTQEVFIKAYRSIKKFSGKSAFFTWLYRIAINTAITQINKNRLHRFFSLEKIDEESAECHYFEYLVGKEKTERSIFLKELQENLNIALQKLSNKHRAVVVLCEVEGFSSADAAVVLKCSEGTVRSRLHYAKEQLKFHLHDYLR
ncbi:MAG: sigma-70 family RNA polymerase sigma factor [Puniceicoccales bacterium]|jgi:RNA polymerase sigma-70 factor (ECF subfamily)|nr:sigma-70 family RNA polymerase sigma factor [Puniceicoccales bacterium]